MGYFTINGIITVSPIGRTQAEKQYVLDTVLQHLPLVRGSSGVLHVQVVRSYSFCERDVYVDEFGAPTDNVYPWVYRRRGERVKCSDATVFDSYTLVVEAALRYVDFEEGFRIFQKWLCRLAKRLYVERLLVQLHVDCYKTSVLIDDADDNGVYAAMYEDKDNWCEYLLWKPALEVYNPYLADVTRIPQEHLNKYPNRVY